MRRALATTAALACTLTFATACGGGTDDAADGGSTETKSIDITFSGDTVTPDGDRVEVGVGQPVDLVITADAPGEIHVHSDPEQQFEYDAGTETIALQIDRPGIVEVESHSLDELIVQLEVE